MSDVGYSATVTISISESGDKSVSVVSSLPVAVQVYDATTAVDGHSENLWTIEPPDVTETTHFIEGGDDGEGDELDFGEGVEPDADDDLPLAAEGGIHVVQH